MIAFWLIAAAMVLAALAVVLPPLMQRPQIAAAKAESDETVATVRVYRERLAELQRDRERGYIGEADYAAAQAEAKRELLQYVPDASSARNRTGHSRLAVVVTAVAVPAIALAVYAASGRPGLLTGDRVDRLTTEQVARFAEMAPADRIPPLESYLAEHPSAPRAWSLLADAYRGEERYGEAVEAFGRARQTSETADARLIARQAEALLLARNRRFTGEVQHLIESSLQVDPLNPLGLMLAGHAAFTRGDTEAAAGHWQRLAEQIPESDRRRQLVDALIARAEGERAAAGATAAADAAEPSNDGATVTVRLRLSETLRGRAQDGDALFVFAHEAGAESGPPLAAQRTTVTSLPAEIALSDAQAMIPGRTLSSADRVVVTARVSRSGNVTPASGDLQGRTAPIPIHRDGPVELTIDEQIE